MCITDIRLIQSPSGPPSMLSPFEVDRQQEIKTDR